MDLPNHHLSSHLRRVGAWYDQDKLRFQLWAPEAKSAEIALIEGKSKVYQSMDRAEDGYFQWDHPGTPTQVHYKIRLDGKKEELPDPASQFQPEGPHGPSCVARFDYGWTDQNWRPPPLKELVIYELHVGTFTEAGDFGSIIPKLEHLKNLGVNAIEVMPVAQFAGERNWGYDGVGLFAVQNTYGGTEPAPVAFKRFINACHENGIAVILDVVYNHLGPEGNYLPAYGPYFQDKYHTPWGAALNYDGDWSDEVRNYFLQNIRQWLEDYHIDGLRLDAVHAILDTSATPFLEEASRLAQNLGQKMGRPYYLIAESETHDSRLLKPLEQDGIGLDGHWADDMHHILHVLLTKENQGYYRDFGGLEQLGEIYKHGLLFQGHYSKTRHRRHGRSYQGVAKHRLVVCSQNHDQIGNRKMGDRLITMVGPEKQKLAAACMFLSPCMPLMFMGEELASQSPFLYFVDHTDTKLREAVQKGRAAEFAAFDWGGDVPDPASRDTFLKSKIDWSQENSPAAQEFKDYYRHLIALSKWIRREGFFEDQLAHVQIFEDRHLLQVSVPLKESLLIYLFSFSEKEETWRAPDQSDLEVLLDSSARVQGTNRHVQGSIKVPAFTAFAFRAERSETL